MFGKKESSTEAVTSGSAVLIGGDWAVPLRK